MIRTSLEGRRMSGKHPFFFLPPYIFHMRIKFQTAYEDGKVAFVNAFRKISFRDFWLLAVVFFYIGFCNKFIVSLRTHTKEKLFSSCFSVFSLLLSLLSTPKKQKSCSQHVFPDFSLFPYKPSFRLLKSQLNN